MRLLGQLLLRGIKVVQVVAWHHVQRFQQRRLHFRHGLRAHMRNVLRHDARPQFFAVQLKAAMPAEVVEAKRVQLAAFWRQRLPQAFFEPGHCVHLHMKGRVAHPHRRYLRHMARQRLCNKAGRVGEVGQQRAGRQFAHVARHLQDYRNGAQRLCHAANASGFLAHETVAQAQVLVCLARVHAAHAQLCGYIRRTAHGGALVRAEHHLERAALGLQHALGKAAHHREAFGINVH